ncbi:hypothetical protein CTR2_R30540 [Comamonas thiooxydans]|uniref:hypothetical protein n=1 Tax=Comamonas thiooxydans TaxID=363952 RepID=UPI0015951FD0|nr:hypothetical protein [Comamonas thiooxydans]BDR09716.1 hypothetical protein CTR2_R30540 [Comamonas thiooxydans]
MSWLRPESSHWMDVSRWLVPVFFERAVHGLQQPPNLRCDADRQIDIHARHGAETAPTFQIILQPGARTTACQQSPINPRSASPLCINDCLGALKRPLKLRGIEYLFCVNLDRAPTNDSHGFEGIVDQLRDFPVTLGWG